MTLYRLTADIELNKKRGVTRQKLADTIAQAVLQLDIRSVDVRGGGGARAFAVKKEGQ